MSYEAHSKDENVMTDLLHLVHSAGRGVTLVDTRWKERRAPLYCSNTIPHGGKERHDLQNTLTAY